MNHDIYWRSLTALAGGLFFGTGCHEILGIESLELKETEEQILYPADAATTSTGRPLQPFPEPLTQDTSEAPLLRSPTVPGSLPQLDGSAPLNAPITDSGLNDAGLEGSDGLPDAASTVDAGPYFAAPIEVRGVVVDFLRRPVPGVPITLAGATVLTDSNGRFSVANIEPPYDIAFTIAADPGGGRGAYDYLYCGLTRTDPTLQAYGAFASRTSELLVEFNDESFDQPNEVAVVAFSGPNGGFVDRLTGTVNLLSAASWFGPTTITGNIHALQLVRESFAGSIPLSYSGYETHPLALNSEGESNISFQSPVEAIQTALVFGNVVEATSARRRNRLALRFTDGTRLPFVDDSTATAEFSYLVPSISGSSIEIAAIEGSIAPLAVAHLDAIAPGQQVSLTVPRPVALQSPVDRTLISREEQFRWSGLGQTARVFVWHMEFLGALRGGAFVVTSDEQTQLPNVPNGTPLPVDGRALWSVETHGDVGSVDAATGPQGLFDSYSAKREYSSGPRSGTGYFTESARREFTLRP